MKQAPAYRLIPTLGIKLVREGSVKVADKHIPNPVTSPAIAHDILKAYVGEQDREHLVVMTLNTKNEAIGLNTVSVGDLGSSIATPREVFKSAVLQNAASIILAHNHPSGNATPSPEDYAVTKRLQDAGNILGIEVLDHIIIGRDSYASIKAGTTFDVGKPQGVMSYDQPENAGQLVNALISARAKAKSVHAPKPW